MSEIKIIDAIMGSGKTSWAIQHINTNRNEKFVYCTPFLSEIERIKEKCFNRNFKEPDYRVNGKKIDSLNKLLEDGENVAVTHCTFSHATPETFAAIKDKGYTLILDEVIEVITPYSDATQDKIGKKDIKHLIHNKFIAIDDNSGQIAWIGEEPPEKYEIFARAAKNGNLYYINKTMLVWVFPPELFKLFDKVYVMTYLFKGSNLSPYFKYNMLDYKLCSVGHDENGYYLTDWHDQREEQKHYKDLIKILDDPELNAYYDTALSSTWYDTQHKNNKNEIARLKSNITKGLKRLFKAKATEIMWSAPKKYEGELQGKGYTMTRRINSDDKEQLTEKQLEQLQKQVRCFVPSNARATNNYAERSALTYPLNIYPNPLFTQFFAKMGEINGINSKIDEDYYALSYMLQWIWRSRIRNNQPIRIYIPSARMREMLLLWLDGRM